MMHTAMPVPDEVWYCLLAAPPDTDCTDPKEAATVGSEQANSRPAIVLANYDFQHIATIIPVTNGAERISASATVIPLGTLRLDMQRTLTGKALVHQIRSVSCDRLETRLGRIVDPAILGQIRNALRKYLRLS